MSDKESTFQQSTPTIQSQMITNRKLNEKNFTQWSRTVKIFFKGQGRIKHLTNEPPSDPVALETWEQHDANLLNMMWNSMEPHIADMTNHFETCKTLWDHLQLMYSNNVSRMYDMTVELYGLQQEDKSLTQYFGEVTRLADDLHRLLPLSSDVQKMQQQRDQMTVIKFLAGLRREYEGVRSQILSGELYIWGRDEGDGRLGLGSGGGPGEGGSFAIPSQVYAIPDPVRSVACGGFFTMALSSEGQLWGWGANSNYELGRGDNISDWHPKPVTSLQDVRIAQIACGGYHSLALTDKGKILSWGHGGHGQLGHNNLQSQKIPLVIDALASKNVVYIACGGSTSAAVTDEGKLYMWGNGRDSQLGVPGLPDVQPFPVEVKFLVDFDDLGGYHVLSVAVGASHAICLVLRNSFES